MPGADIATRRGLPPLAFEKCLQSGLGPKPVPSADASRHLNRVNLPDIVRSAAFHGWLATREGLGAALWLMRHVRTAPKGMLTNASGSGRRHQQSCR